MFCLLFAERSDCQCCPDFLRDSDLVCIISTLVGTQQWLRGTALYPFPRFLPRQGMLQLGCDHLRWYCNMHTLLVCVACMFLVVKLIYPHLDCVNACRAQLTCSTFGKTAKNVQNRTSGLTTLITWVRYGTSRSVANLCMQHLNQCRLLFRLSCSWASAASTGGS